MAYNEICDRCPYGEERDCPCDEYEEETERYQDFLIDLARQISE